MAYLHHREILTLLLMAICLTKTKKILNCSLALKIIFFICVSMIIGAFTALDTDIPFAVDAILTFLNFIWAAFFLIAVSETKQQAWNLFFIGFIITMLSGSMAIVQIFVGELTWLQSSNQLAAIEMGRFGMPRYLSLLGDPNLHGLIGNYGIFIATIMRRKNYCGKAFSRFLIIVGLLLVAVSLSKMAIVTLFGCLFYLKKYSQLRLFKWSNLILVSFLSFFIIEGILVSSSEDLSFMYIFQRFFSDQKGGLFSSGFLNDLFFRMAGRGSESLITAKILLVGDNFSVAGIAAKQAGYGILPHNYYYELVLVGGVGLVTLFIFIVLSAFKSTQLMTKNASHLHSSEICLMQVILIGVSVMSLGFPLPYSSGVGYLFWSCVGLISIQSNRLIRIY